MARGTARKALIVAALMLGLAPASASAWTVTPAPRRAEGFTRVNAGLAQRP